MTARNLAEKAMKEQYAILHGIIDSVDALIFSVDRHYRYTSFNKAHAAVMKALYGAEIDHGHCILDVMSVSEDRETARRNLDRALAGEQLVEEAYSGEELRSRQYFQVSHSPIETDTGEVIGVAVLAQDLTERKRVELEILDRQQRLSELIGRYTVVESLKTGCNGLHVKECASEELVMGIRAIFAGKPYFCGGATQLMIKGFVPAAEPGQTAPVLTNREGEVLKLTAKGYNTKESAFELGVSTKMIETHRRHIKNKLGLKNAAQMTTYAVRNGLIAIDEDDCI